jgi:hypothetical protein
LIESIKSKLPVSQGQDVPDNVRCDDESGHRTQSLAVPAVHVAQDGSQFEQVNAPAF